MQSYEELTTCNLRSNVYKVFYLKSPRQWCRLIISIQIHRSSIYWPATKTAQHENARPLVGSASLPYSLINAIQDFLRAENVEDDNSLQFSLTGDDSIQKQQCKSRSKLLAMVTKFSSAVPTALAFLDDLGCRQYFESEVTQVELHDESYFISCIGGKLVYEVKFANPVPSCELLYNIRVLHCMNGVSSFPNLVGVVVDDSGKYLKSYCLEFPKARKNLSQALEDLSVPWAQRERWAKQLVEGVSQLHDRGFVVGTLLADRSTVIIEESNSIQFWYLKSRFHAGNSHISGYYPPEFRHLSKLSRTTNENQCPNISSKTDIYHLGLALWRIVETSSGKNSSPICARKRCNQEAGPCKDQSHFDPITLPRLHGSIPTYYQKIVDACRAEDPNNRPAARRLLEKFPVTTQALPCFTCETPGPEITDLVAMGDCLKGTVTCDRCRERSIRLPFFHCNVCLTGDYDICHACYVKGAHCKDTTHLLVEMTKVGSLIVAGKYHSDVKSSGRRDILEL